MNLGGDPEFFIINNATNKIVPPRTFFNEARHVGNNYYGVRKGKMNGLDYYYIRDANNDGTKLLKEDNAQVEFELPPTSCRETVNSTVSRRFKKVKSILESINKRKKVDWSFSATPSAELDPKDMEKDVGLINIFGCAPDFNAYTNEKQTPPEEVIERPVRTAGAHIHLGYDASQGWREKYNPKLAIVFDYYLANTMVFLEGEQYREASIARRKIYGNNGAYRNPKHGFEYRSLNPTIYLSSGLLSLIYGFVKTLGHTMINNTDRFDSWFNKLLDIVEPMEIIHNINNHDIESAYQTFHVLVPHFKSLESANYISNFYRNESGTRYEFFFEKIEFMKEYGIESSLKNISETFPTFWENGSKSGIQNSFPSEKTGDTYKFQRKHWPQFLAKIRPDSSYAKQLFPEEYETPEEKAKRKAEERKIKISVFEELGLHVETKGDDIFISKK